MLEQRAVSGVKWTTISTVLRAALQILLLAVVAHALSAEEIGLYALVQLVYAFCMLSFDLGIGPAVVHYQHIAPKRLKQLGTINFAIAAIIALLLWLCSPLIAALFDAEALADLLRVICLCFLILGISRINLALLQKALLFSQISIAEIIASLAGFGLSVYLVFNDFGVMALVYGFVIQQALLSLFYFSFTGFSVFLAIPVSPKKLKKYITYGVYKSLDGVVNYFNSQIDVIVVAKVLGTEILGGYNLVRQLCFRPAMVINPVITRVAFPFMAKLQRSEKLSPSYLTMVNLLASVNFPLYVAFAVLAEPIVVFVFGERWIHLVPVLQLLSIWCLVRSVLNPVGSLMMAIGKVKLLWKWNTSLLLLFPPVLIVAGQYSLFSIALSLVVLQLMVIPGHWWLLLNKTIGIKMSEFISSIWQPFLYSLLCGIIVMLVNGWIGDFSPLLRIVCGLILGATLFLMMNVWFRSRSYLVIRQKMSA